MIKIKHQASTKPNKCIHWFHLLGVKNRAIAYDLADDKPIGAVSDLQSGDILPSTKDNQDFCMISYHCLLGLLWIKCHHLKSLKMLLTSSIGIQML
jgi:hypothetical protein